MRRKSIRDYFFEKLVFPKRAIIDKPGILINQLSRRYGGIKNRQRTVYFFEDVFLNLQLETIKCIGREKSSKLWYEIGEAVGKRYLALGGSRAVPPSLLPLVIDYVFSGFRSGGLSLATNIKFNSINKSLILSGQENMVCRKSEDPSFFMGITSAIYSSLIDRDVKVLKECGSCPDNCRVVASPCARSKKITKCENLDIIKDYEKWNFPEVKKSFNRFYSFSDLIRFNEVSMDKTGKFNFRNCAIITSEAGALDLIMDKFEKAGHIEIIKRALSDGSEKLSESFLNLEDSTYTNLDVIKKTLCAFGWGIPDIKIDKKEIISIFSYPPISQYNALYLPFLLNGYLNYIFQHKLKIKDIKVDKNLHKIVIVYSF